jgi:circadian clock protein KaiC
MSSIGIDLNPWIKRELLQIHAARPTATGLEGHLAVMHKLVTSLKPNVVVLDPITNLVSVGDLASVKAMLTRLIDFLKINGITAMFTNLVFEGAMDGTAIGISSLMDTWLVLRSIDQGADRIRSLSLLKSRGMSHDTSVHEFTLSDKGISINGKQETISAKRAG